MRNSNFSSDGIAERQLCTAVLQKHKIHVWTIIVAGKHAAIVVSNILYAQHNRPPRLPVKLGIL